MTEHSVQVSETAVLRNPYGNGSLATIWVDNNFNIKIKLHYDNVLDLIFIDGYATRPRRIVGTLPATSVLGIL